MKYLLMLMMILLMYSRAVAEEYKMVKKENNISIYERWIVRHNNAKVRELKVVFNAKTTCSEVIALVKNEEAGVRWNGRAETYMVIPKQAGYWVNYIKYKTPIGMDNQDWCVQYYQPASSSSAYTELFFESTADSRFPATKDVKRISGVKGRWILEEQNGGYVKITYIISTNKDSSIPRWLADPVIHNTIFDTMDEFKKLLERNNYE